MRTSHAVILSLALLASMLGCSDHRVRTQTLGSLDRIKSLKHIAVLPFDCEDKSLGGSFSDAMGLGLMAMGYEVVERSQLTAIVAESDLRATNMLRKDAIENTGRLLGADALMLGTIQLVEAYDFTTHWRVIRTVTSRLVDVETGKSLMIMTYSRDTDLSTEGVTDIADELCSDFRRNIVK